MPTAPGPARTARDGWWRRLCAILFADLPPRGRDWALMAVAGLLSAAIRGYSYGLMDQALLLPYVKHLLDPSLYPGDILLEGARTMQPIFWRMLAAAAHIIPLPTLVLGLHIVASALTVVAAWALAVNLFRNRDSANLGLLVLALSIPMEYALGLDVFRLAWPELVQRSVVLPWLLFALTLALHRRLAPALMLVGLSFNVHPVSSVAVGMMIFVGGLLDPKARRGLPLASVAAVACASPMLLGMALKPGAVGTTAEESGRWFELLRLRVSHHMFPLTWSAERWLGTVLLLAAGLRALLAVRTDAPRHRTALAWFIVPIALWIPGLLFTEIWPVPILTMMQFFRATKFAVVIGLLYFCHHQVVRMSTGPAVQIGVGLLSMLVVPALWALPVAAAVVLVLPHLFFPGPGERATPSGGWPVRLAVAGLLLVMAAATTMAVSERVQSKSEVWWGRAPQQWRDVQEWVREHSPVGATVLVPPETTGFRVFSERPVVGVLKDGGLHQNDPRSLARWWERMQALGCEAASGEEGPFIRCGDFEDLSAEPLADIARRYGADLLVTHRDHDLPWEPLYANEEWAVYDLPAGEPFGDEGPAMPPDE